jgi:predicted component of type VI protein secretion system
MWDEHGPTRAARRVARVAAHGKLIQVVPELILSLRERELSRFSITAMRTTIGRDPSCDVVIDNAGISRLHAAIEAVGDSFLLRDCDSQNGITLNGEPCREGRLVHGDIVGMNKFLLRFSNQALEAPTNLKADADRPRANRPKDVQRTVHVDAEAAQQLAEMAKQHIAKKRAELAALGGESLPPQQKPERPAPKSEPMQWEEAAGSGATGATVALWVGAVVLGGALLAALLFVVF